LEKSFKLETLDRSYVLADLLARRLSAGDAVYLKGPVGAGKTEIARRIIQSLQAAEGVAEDVPSPTFTLVQTYQAGDLEIWHADLYRLSTLDELHELGLFEAMDSALVLIEWPERMGALLPKNGLTLDVGLGHDDGRTLRLEWSDAKWDSIVKEIEQALAVDD
jgi:tRNA threonylcarbamoyl adenosine modification protein YjeE